MTRRLNPKFLLVLLVVTGVLVGGGRWLHANQLKKNANYILTQAEQAAQKKEYPKALTYLSHYLTFKPTDGRARAKYGVILAHRAKSFKEIEFAYLTIERAIREEDGLEVALRDDAGLQALARTKDEKDADADTTALADAERNIRRRAAELALSIGQFGEAKVHLEAARRVHPQDANLLVTLGECEELLGKNDLAAKAYRDVVAAHPTHVKGYVRLAGLLRRTGKGPDADAVVDALVKANPSSVRARLAAVQYFKLAGRRDAMRQNLEAAAAAGDLRDDKDLLLATADVEIADGNEAAARAALTRGLELHPKELSFYVVLAELDLRAGKKDAAVALLRKADGILPKGAAEVWVVADFLIDADARADAQSLVARLRDEKADAAAVDFLDARLLLGAGKVAAAAALFRKHEAEFARRQDLAPRAQLLLAACYERLGNPDLRLKAARQAATLAPTFLPARLAHADALLGVEKYDEAIEVYRGAYGVVPQARVTVAKIQIALGRLPAAEETLAGMPPGLEEAATTFYRVLILARSNDPAKRDRARKAVAEARDKYPTDAAFWVLLADTAGTPADGLAILDKAQAAAGNGTAIRLARATLLVRQKAPPAALRPLEADAAALTVANRTALWLGLSTAHLRLGSAADAERLIRQTVDARPGDLTVLFRLFEVIADTAPPQALDDLRKQVQEAEGGAGATWRLIDAYRAWRVYLQGKAAADLEHARKQLNEAGKERPEWFWVPLLKGEIEDKLGNTDAAIDFYLRAVRNGAVQPGVVARAATLLWTRRRVAEAQQLIADLRSRSVALPVELERLDLALGAGAGAEALIERLNVTAPESSTNYRDHLLRAALLAAAGRMKEAEAAHRKAVALAPAAPEAWIGLVLILARTDRVAEARTEIANAAKAVPADNQALTLGACFEMIGDRAEAEKHYTQATKERAAPDAQRALAAFYLNGGEAAKAEPILRRLLTESADKRWARRALALSLAAGGYAQGTEALGLLQDNLKEYPDNPEDLRTQALIRASRPGERAAAIKDMEVSFLRLPAAPVEEIMLARLYELEGNWPKAKERLVAVVGRNENNTAALATYVAALLRNKDVDTAEERMAQLKTKVKERTPEVVELQARIDAARGRGAAAAQAVKAFARDAHAAKPNPKVLRAAATLLAELKLAADGEELLREYVKATEPTDPVAPLVLADYMARHQNRVADALAVCAAALARVDPDVVAQQVVATVRLGDATAAQFAAAEELVQAAAKAKPGSADIPVSLADLRDAQGRYDEAKAMYRAILRANPRSALAMNNLAWLLALHEAGPKAESLAHLETAAALIGRDGNLLDTRAVVLLSAGDPAQAITDLTAAIAQDPRPERYFHLAQAHLKARNETEAKRAMRKANADGLSKKDLHKLEWKAYDELVDLSR